MDYWDKRWDKDQEDEFWPTQNKSFWADEDYEQEQKDFSRNKRAGVPRKFSLDFLTKFQKQSIMAVMLFFMVLAAKYSNDPTANLVFDTVKTALSSQNDYSVALNNWAKGFISGDGLVAAVKSSGEMLAPVNGSVVNKFGWQVSALDQEKRYNAGIDLAASLGTYILAPQAGTVVKVGTDSVLGRYVKLDHGDGYTSVLSNFGEISVKAQQKVKKGDQLGTLGFTAAVKRPWLHWELRKNNQPVDPQTVMAKTSKT